MGLETGAYISDLVTTNPALGDVVSQGDDHIRLLKSTIKATFPAITGAVTPTHTELNYVDGVTSNIQTQLDALVAADLTKLPLAGGTMTGDIVLAGNPDAALKAAPKQYVDAGDALALPKAGGTMTGQLALVGDPIADADAARKKYVDDAGAALEASFGPIRVFAAGAFVGYTDGSYGGAYSFSRSGSEVTVTMGGGTHPFLVGSIIHCYSSSDSYLNEKRIVVTEISDTSFKFVDANTAASGTFYIRGGLVKGSGISNIYFHPSDATLVTFTFSEERPDTNYIPMSSGYHVQGYGYNAGYYYGNSISQYKEFYGLTGFIAQQKRKTYDCTIDFNGAMGFLDPYQVMFVGW